MLAEKLVEHLHTPGRGKDCGVHGPWGSIHTDSLCSPGSAYGERLHACQTLRLSLQCLHTQLPLLWQKWGWEGGSGQNNQGTKLFYYLKCVQYVWMCVGVHLCVQKKLSVNEVLGTIMVVVLTWACSLYCVCFYVSVYEWRVVPVALVVCALSAYLCRLNIH